MNAHSPEYGPITLLVTERIDNAFDVLYPSEDGSFDSYPYGILCLEDRDGNQYVWPQAPEADLAKPKPHLGGLRPGQFITAPYRVRDSLPGPEQEWHVPEPSGTYISHLNFRAAKKADRWPSHIKVEKPDYLAIDAMLDEIIASDG